LIFDCNDPFWRQSDYNRASSGTGFCDGIFIHRVTETKLNLFIFGPEMNKNTLKQSKNRSFYPSRKTFYLAKSTL